MILGENGEKMSKSRGNVINPDDIINEFGADTMRLYEMFIGDFEKAAPWSTSSIKGCKRFLDRTYALLEIVNETKGYSPELEASMHRLIKKVSDDIEALKCNTAIAAMMAMINEFYAKGSVTKDELKTFLLLLNPFAPHITEEIWQTCGFKGMITDQSWPSYDESKTQLNEIELPIQVNGKVRATMKVNKGIHAFEAIEMAKKLGNIQPLIVGKQLVKEIYIPDKIINFVVK
ncbi:Leucine--tRNA ligase [bioreactor metagenome]|uniref:leucine--tRNA ligase n=1 Tax=bioreactor metagenome TaxID=1076179 RepID=A0A645E6A2_9ZZZZ